MNLRIAWFLAAMCLAGCTSAKTSNTARTGMEQLLVANAVDQSLNKVDFRPFAGSNVYVDTSFTDCVDKGYVVASVRHRLVTSGAHLVDSKDAADVVVELRTGAVGTDSSESFVGFPEIALPGLVTLPEVRLLTRSYQTGVAKLGLVAYETNTGVALGSGGQSLARSDDANWFVMGMGPWQTGSVREEVKRSTTGSAAFAASMQPARVVFAPPQPNLTHPDLHEMQPETEMRYTGGEEPTSQMGPAGTAIWWDER